jgi:hypothetical protein
MALATGKSALGLNACHAQSCSCIVVQVGYEIGLTRSIGKPRMRVSLPCISMARKTRGTCQVEVVTHNDHMVIHLLLRIPQNDMRKGQADNRILAIHVYLSFKTCAILEQSIWEQDLKLAKTMMTAHDDIVGGMWPFSTLCPDALRQCRAMHVGCVS